MGKMREEVFKTSSSNLSRRGFLFYADKNEKKITFIINNQYIERIKT